MKYHFIKKDGCEGINKVILDNESLIHKAINENRISDYIKAPIIKVGDYLTCCDPKDSLVGEKHNHQGHGFKLGLTFKINRIDHHRNHIVYWGAYKTHGVYQNEIRLATEKEIKKLKKIECITNYY